MALKLRSLILTLETESLKWGKSLKDKRRGRKLYAKNKIFSPALSRIFFELFNFKNLVHIKIEQLILFIFLTLCVHSYKNQIYLAQI